MNLPFLSVRLVDLEVGRRARAPFDGDMSPSSPSLHCTTALQYCTLRIFLPLWRNKNRNSVPSLRWGGLRRPFQSRGVGRGAYVPLELMVRAASRRCTTSHHGEGGPPVHPGSSITSRAPLPHSNDRIQSHSFIIIIIILLLFLLLSSVETTNAKNFREITGGAAFVVDVVVVLFSSEVCGLA